MKTPKYSIKSIAFHILFLILFALSNINAQEKKDTSLIILKNIITPELQKKISGVKYASMILNQDQIDVVVNQKQEQDLLVNLSNYFKEKLGIQKFAFTIAQNAELSSSEDISLCDIVNVDLDYGKFYRTLGALGVYRRVAINFNFCDDSKYRVMLSEISVDGYSYHPNRFYAAFKRIQTPKLQYDANNKLELKKLQIIGSRQYIDSIITNSSNPIIGEYKSLGLDKNSPSYQIAIIPHNEKYVLVYTGGVKNKDWEIGELKAELTPTKSDKIYLCKWYTANKTPKDDINLIFDDFNSFQLSSNNSNDKYVRLK